MDKLKLNEFLSTGCESCQATMEKIMVTYLGPGGRAQKTLVLAPDQRLLIAPDYNASGVLTGFHVDLVKRGDSV